MSFPTIPTAGGGTLLSNVQADTTPTRTFPSLSSLTKNSGDLLIAIIVAYQTSTGTNAAFSSWGGGFTEFHDSATSTTLAMGAAYKWSTGSETGTFSVTQAGTITGHAAMFLVAIPGAHASTPPEAGSRASSTAGSANPAAFDPAGWATEDTLWIAVGGSGETATTGSWTAISAAPSQYSIGFAVTSQSGDAIGTVQGAVGFRQNAVSSEDVGNFTSDTSNTRDGIFVIAVRGLPNAVLTQEAYRFRNDDGSETAATWRQAVNTADTNTLDTKFRIRLAISNDATAVFADDYSLQYRRMPNGGAFGSWTAAAIGHIGTAGETSTHYAAFDATTQQISSGTFDAGQMLENGSVTSGINHPVSTHTEVEFMCKASTVAGAAQGDTYEFRLIRETGSGVLDTYTVTPTLTIPIPPPVLNQEGYRFRNDDGNETAATWRQAVNTPETIALETPFRLRFAVENTGGVFTLRYVVYFRRKPFGGAWGSWTLMSAASATPINAAPFSIFYATNDPTTQQISSGTFDAGTMNETASLTANVNQPNATKSEFEFMMTVNAASGAAAGDEYEIRLRNFDGGADLDTYTQTASLTIPGGSAPGPASSRRQRRASRYLTFR